MKFLVTGHTGFKGSWLVLLLRAMGHQVEGISLAPLANSHFAQAGIEKLCNKNSFLDIRNKLEFQNQIMRSDAEIVVHLAAQSLVRESYKNPVGTFETNFNGTLNLLEVIDKNHSFQSCIIVTTDKVYLNSEKKGGYSEDDALGGADPYSASKVAADIMTQAWRKSQSLNSIPINIVRAGNVIGGGDWSENRLIPDLVRSIETGSPALIRNPYSIRPWQHVLDCLTGYLALVRQPITLEFNSEWNFGPDANNELSVELMVNMFLAHFEGSLGWQLDDQIGPKETSYLTLNSSKARSQLNWKEYLPLEKGITMTAEWYKKYLLGENVLKISSTQIDRYLELK